MIIPIEPSESGIKIPRGREGIASFIINGTGPVRKGRMVPGVLYPSPGPFGTKFAHRHLRPGMLIAVFILNAFLV